MTRQERFSAMFAAIDAEGQDFILDMLEGEYERIQKVRRPVLRVIQGAARIAGIDIDQLLSSIGEASANDGSTALFGLLLNAQQVLAQVQADRARTATHRESALSATYHTLNDAGQEWLIGFARQLQKGFPRQRVALTLARSTRLEVCDER